VETASGQKSSAAFLSACLICLIHRQALECEHVSMQLPNWLDLIFGVKQSGEPAHLAMNVYHLAVRIFPKKNFFSSF
jgi:Flp pilus assembly protein TadB